MKVIATRITTAGYSYDAAGNLTNDIGLSSVFDAENKIKRVSSETDVYRYDGDGNRVRKNFTSGEKVRMVYSGGQLIAEYDLSTGSLKEFNRYLYGIDTASHPFSFPIELSQIGAGQYGMTKVNFV
jgi:YD repeat-containing protein